MKSTFLFLVILVGLFTNPVLGQNKKATKKTSQSSQTQVKSSTVTTSIAPSQNLKAELPKSSFDKFYERLGISYFGVLTTPNFKKWDTRNAAVSPEFSSGTNKDDYPLHVWSQVNFSYNYGGPLKFNVIPRFTVFLDDAPRQGPGDRGMVVIEDALVAFSGVVYSSVDKKLNWWIRPGARLPTSRGSQNANDAAFGRLSYQVEFLHTLSYDFTKEFQAGVSFMHRLWVYEDRYNLSRIRHLTNPYVSYTLNDTTKIQAYYENMIQNNRRWKSINGKDPHYTDVWQNAYIGVAKDVTPKLNLFPYIGSFVNTVPFSTKAFYAGMWIAYSIK